MMKSKFTVVVCALAIALAAVIGIYITLIATRVVDSTPKKLVISSGTAEKVYDGKEITSADWKLDSGTLREGHRLKVTTMGNQTDVGSCDNEFTAVVLDENGADVSEDYELVLKPGKLVVRARMLVIKSASAAWRCKMCGIYPLTCCRLPFTPTAKTLPTTTKLQLSTTVY